MRLGIPQRHNSTSDITGIIYNYMIKRKQGLSIPRHGRCCHRSILTDLKNNTHTFGPEHQGYRPQSQRLARKTMTANEAILLATDKDGNFQRKDSTFRNFVSADSDAEFPAEKGRYVLYLNLGCPWYSLLRALNPLQATSRNGLTRRNRVRAHRTNIVHKLKGLQDIVEIVIMGYVLDRKLGW